jgi:hypothetical protein
MLKEVEALKDHRHTSAITSQRTRWLANPFAPFINPSSEQLASKQYATGVWLLEEVDTPQQRALAATARSDDGRHVSGAYRERDTFQDL